MAAVKKKKIDTHVVSENNSSDSDMNAAIEVSEDNLADVAEEVTKAEPMISLDVALSIQTVVSLYEKIKNSYAVYDTLEINASGVSSIDTATLQLLVALKKDAAKQQKEIIFTEPTPRFIESAGLLGLLDILGLNT
jgi:anti-anti-sigma regulatory factor